MRSLELVSDPDMLSQARKVRCGSGAHPCMCGQGACAKGAGGGRLGGEGGRGQCSTAVIRVQVVAALIPAPHLSARRFLADKPNHFKPPGHTEDGPHDKSGPIRPPGHRRHRTHAQTTADDGRGARTAHQPHRFVCDTAAGGYESRHGGWGQHYDGWPSVGYDDESGARLVR